MSFSGGQKSSKKVDDNWSYAWLILFINTHLNLTPLVRSPQRLYWCIVCHCRCLINNLLLLSFVNNAEPLMLGVVRHTLLGSFALKLLCQIFLRLSWYLFICFFIDKWHCMKFSMLTLSSKLNEPDKDNSTNEILVCFTLKTRYAIWIN